jgi:hypothetical protein
MERVFKVNPDLTTVSRILLGGNPKRISALFINSSDAVAYISLGTPAVATQDIPLPASGGWYEINLLNPYHGEVHALSAGATKRLSVTEVSS